MEESKKVRQNRPKKKNRHTGLIAAALVLALAVAGFFGIGAHASNLKTSMPGLTINGIDVGGCTLDEIAEKISGQTAETLGYKNLTVKFSDEVSFEITPEDAGITNVGEVLSQQIYDYGKGGNIFSNAISFIKCTMAKSDVSVGKIFNIDEENVRRMITENANKAMNANSEGYRIEGDKLYVTKGALTLTIEPENVYNIVKAAYENMDFTQIDYEADQAEEKVIDIDNIHSIVYSELVEATYNKETGEITDSSPGIDFDLDAAKAKFDSAANGETIEIPLISSQPKTSAEVLRTRLFADTLAKKSTSLGGSSANRKNNITLAAKAINGTILNPGEVFSYNGTVGERTTAKGYKPAYAYVGGETIEQVGGGICQVSSTLYYCTLMSCLEVVDRSEHMFPVSYLPYGLDATVNWGTLDYKFKNTTNYPIKLSLYVEGSTLYVSILGTQERTDGHKFELTYKTVSTTARPVEEKYDPSLAPGTTKVQRSGHDGLVVNSYRNEYDANGKLVNSEFIAKSAYKTQSKIILVGPEKTPDPTPDPEPDPTPDPTPDPEPDPTPDPTPDPDTGGEGE